MSHGRKIIKKGVLFDTKSGAEIMKFDSKSKDNKYYAAVLMCGHTGREYYVPILFPFICKNMDEAITLAKATARVKRNNKNFILSISEIDENQFKLISLINDNDDYLMPAYIGFSNNSLDGRKLLTPEYVELVNLNNKKDPSKRDVNLENLSVKTAEDFTPRYVLQRAFAPKISNVRMVKRVDDNGNPYEEKQVTYISPSHVKIESFIDDYLTAETFRLGVKRKIISIVSIYYQMYGPKNELGIRYNNKQLSFFDQFGDLKFFDLSDSMISYLEDESVGYRHKPNVSPYKQIKRRTDYEEIPHNQVEKFYKRQEKTKQLNQEKSQGTQPGEE